MINHTEYERRYSGRVYGKRRARVIENQDPERRGRIKVENAELYGSTRSPWVMPCFPFYGGVDCGFFSVPPVGSVVWIECEEGLPEYPIYSGGYFDLTNGGHVSDGSEIENSLDFQGEPSAAPAHARGDFDGSDYGALKGRFGVPASTYEADYGEVTILQTKAGHRLEFDDTVGGERVQILHKKGTHIEILPDGSVVIATEGKITTRSGHTENIVIDAQKEFVGGDSKATIDGDVTREVGGSTTSSVAGSSTSTLGSFKTTVDGRAEAVCGDVDLQSVNNLQLSIGGELGVISFGDCELSIAGKTFLSFSNASQIPEPVMVTPSGDISAVNGTLRLSSRDLLDVGNYGVEMRGGASGQVFLGSLSSLTRTASLGVTSVPLLKERAVVGEQLSLFLEAVMGSLDAFFSAMQTGGSTPGYGGPNPVLATAATTAFASLATARATFLTPSLILSNCVYLSRG